MSKVKLSEISNPQEITIFNFASSGALGLGGANYGNSGEVITSQGSTSTPIWSSNSVNNTILFTASGTYIPTSGKTTFLVYCIGGGGTVVGSSGGGAGGCAWRVYDSTQMGSGAVVTVGSVGSPAGNSVFDPSGSGITLTGGGANPTTLTIGSWWTGTATNGGGSSTGSLTQWVGNPGNNNGVGGHGIFGAGNGATYNGAAATAGAVFIYEF